MIEKTPTPHHRKNAALPFNSYGKQCLLRVTYYKCNRQQLIFASIQSRVPAPRFESRKKIATLLTTARKGHNYIGHQSTYPAYFYATWCSQWVWIHLSTIIFLLSIVHITLIQHVVWLQTLQIKWILKIL